MLRKLNLLLASILLTAFYGFSQTGLGTIRGSVIDRDSKEPIPECIVAVKQNGQVKGNTTTDFDGKFQINSLPPGQYDVEISNPGEGYQASAIKGVVVNSDRITFLDNTELGLPKDVKDLEEVVVVAYKVPLITKDGGPSGGTVTREDFSKMPARDAASAAATVGGVNQDESSGAISVRGSRSEGTYFYIDGIKVRGSSNLPKSAIEEVSVITGGVPANYGDVTGGIVSITTRGPSERYFGSIEGVTSGFYFKGKDVNGYDGKVIGLDKFGYNLVEGMLSGPLLMKKDSTGKKVKPILGFLVSVNYTDQLDSRPLNGGSYRIKKEARDYLLENPVRASSTGDGTFSNAYYLRASDFEKTAWRMNARRSALSASAKIDVNTGPSINLTFGGSLNYSFGSNYDYNSSLMNFTNYGVYNQLDWRVYGRFTQRFSNTKEGSSSKVKSAFYTLMVDYSKSKSESYDKNHKYNLFNYGHVGTFVTTRNPSYAFNNQTLTYEHNGFRDELVTFTPSETNTALAAITTQYYNIYANDPQGHYENLLQIQQGRALRNGDVPTSVYGIWNNLGAPNNGFGRNENDQFRLTGSGSVNLGDHTISLGFEYEQRWDRGWGDGDAGPIALWTIARQYANFHIKELDYSTGTYESEGAYQRVTYDRLNSGYAYTSGTGNYGGAENNDNQSFFDYNLRQKLGFNPAGTDFIDIDQYDPNLFDLGMFSSDELFNQGTTFVNYYGYDRTGKKVKGSTDIDKYFNEFDENGNYKRFIGAFQPVYIAGYIMDKFAFKDIVFNVGVRVDVFDANQPVLKDKYLVYTANTVSEARAMYASNPSAYAFVQNIPTSMGDDYVVYVNDVNNPTTINGFRSGDTWYNAEGIVIEDPKLIRGATGIAPWLKDPTAANTNKVKSDAFEDYKPQINVMPRVAFSFPISDQAAFFAHYDILTKRPTTGVRFNPIDYQFISNRTNVINNPNLKPEQTISYEIGFQQVVTKTSSLKISAFYNEQRNMVQLMNVFEAYPNTYRTYGNRDFGTVKGLTVSYDLRRTGNVRMTAAYTLQFADGTGSDATSAASLLTGLQTAGIPNLRSVFPYSYNNRHTFAITFDYRYGEGADYNGPMIGDAKILENTGLNLIANVYSGSLYTSQNNITGDALLSPNSAGITGTLNGSQLPWQYRLDLQLDRSWAIDFGKEGKKKSTYLNVYLRVTNLFNAMNVLGVYRATGNWNDDGYLAAAQYQTTIQNQLDEQSYRDYYNMKVANPFNISAPRTIRLGVKFDF